MHCTRALAAAVLAVLCSLSTAQDQADASTPPALTIPAATAAEAAAGASASASASASEGRITYYGGKFTGRKTASGERFNPGAMTMAHKTLPFGTRVKVTNLANQRSVVLRVNDRGPVSPQRIGDVSTGAARKLAMLGLGVIHARLEVLGSDVR